MSTETKSTAQEGPSAEAADTAAPAAAASGGAAAPARQLQSFRAKATYGQQTAGGAPPPPPPPPQPPPVIEPEKDTGLISLAIVASMFGNAFDLEGVRREILIPGRSPGRTTSCGRPNSQAIRSNAENPASTGCA